MSNCQTAVEISLTMLTHSVTALFHRNRIFSIHHYIKTVLHYVILIDRHREKRVLKKKKKSRSVLADEGKLTILMKCLSYWPFELCKGENNSVKTAWKISYRI